MATEDVTGLWELIWALNAQLPQATPEIRLFLAQHVLLDLLRDGLVALVRWNPTTRTERAVTANEAILVLAEVKSWSPPERDTERQFRFHSTPKGNEAYFELAALAS